MQDITISIIFLQIIQLYSFDISMCYLLQPAMMKISHADIFGNQLKLKFYLQIILNLLLYMNENLIFLK